MHSASTHGASLKFSPMPVSLSSHNGQARQQGSSMLPHILTHPQSDSRPPVPLPREQHRAQLERRFVDPRRRLSAPFQEAKQAYFFRTLTLDISHNDCHE